MLTLCGFAVSNYYNKVKIALLEKGVPFEESLVWADESPALLAKSPLGKVPYLETEDGVLVESQVLMNYIEARYPQVPLLPSDLYAAARVHELITFLEVHLELVARELYYEAFFGGKVSDEVKARAKKTLIKHIAGFAKLAKFGPFIAGAEFTMADCAAVVHLPLVARATKKIFGEDLLAALPVAAYLDMMEQRPVIQKVNADRAINMAQFMAAKAG